MINVITHIAKAIILIATSFLLFSCNLETVNGNGKVATKERSLSGDYQKISAGSGLEVIIEQGSGYSVIVEADENLHQHIRTEVSGNTLEISTDANIGNATAKKVIVRLPHIEGIEAGSGCTVTSRNTLKDDTIDLSTSSRGNMEVAIEAKKLICEASSGSKLKVSGRADKLNAEASSNGSLNASGLAAEKVKADASSGGTIYVDAESSLSANASSGGKIFYAKVPDDLHKDTSSGGEVVQE
jgi:Putative auto-transporter adhesin, head GIN domain